MEKCDVLIVGGGPAGSSCAWFLVSAGFDVAVIDKAPFPRDKTCAGWITPPVIDALQIGTDDYRQGRTFQPITAFRIGLIGSERVVDAMYDRPVSFGIRRCEFDDYLLRRSGARLQLGAPVSHIRRNGRVWVIDDRIETPMLVGAGGHFCPVARMLNGVSSSAPLITAQEAEFAIAGSAMGFAVAPERPELYFCPDLGGYGWCFRKQDYVNIGFGRIDTRGLPAARGEFVEFMQNRNVIPGDSGWKWRGHAYLTSGRSRRRTGAGVLLAGDSAGLAQPASGEGIRPAIESGLLAAMAIREARHDYSLDRLRTYERQLRCQFDGGVAGRLFGHVPRAVTAALGRHLLQAPTAVPSVLDRWFLNAPSNRSRADVVYSGRTS